MREIKMSKREFVLTLLSQNGIQESLLTQIKDYFADSSYLAHSSDGGNVSSQGNGNGNGNVNGTNAITLSLVSHSNSPLRKSLAKVDPEDEDSSKPDACIELFIVLNSNSEENESLLPKIQKDLLHLGSQFNTDITIQRESVFRHHKRLVIFDMDSTLIQQEVIDEIARYAGIVNKVAVSPYLLNA
jgi:hypothetical protein